MIENSGISGDGTETNAGSTTCTAWTTTRCRGNQWSVAPATVTLPDTDEIVLKRKP